MRKLLIGAAVLLLAVPLLATQQPGNEYFFAWYAGGNADTHRYRAAHFDSTQGTPHRYFHGEWSFYNQSDSQAIIGVYQLDGTTGAAACSLVINLPAGACWNPDALFDSVRVVPAASGDSVHVTVVGDRDNTCNHYGGGPSTLP